MLQKTNKISPFQTATRFYKYLTRDYANKALLFGELRVGTLSHFRKEEINDDERQDKGEGKFIRYIDDDIIGSPTPQQAKIIPKNFSFVNCNFTDCERTMVFEEKIDDLFIYCLSTKKSQKLMSDFCRENGACLEVLDIHGLISGIDHALKKQGILATFIGAGHCKYLGREFSYRDISPKDPAFLLKPERYTHQSEFRLVWAPKRKPISPINIYCPKPSKLFRMVKW